MQKYFDVVQDNRGNAIAGASVTIYDTGTSTVATLYSDDGVTASANPLTTSSLGYFEFYAANGKYDIKITGTSLTTQTITNVELYDDVDDDSVPYEINVKDPTYGAVGDGVTDDTAAFVAAWAAATAHAYPRLYIPAGTYILSSVTSRFIPVSNMVVYGDGMHNTQIYWQNESLSADNKLIGSNSSDPDITALTIRDIHFRGSHGDGGDYTQSSYYPLLFRNVTESLVVQNVQVSYSRVMGIVARNCWNVQATGCWVHHCARDGINFQQCNVVSIIGNTCEFCDDDMIAVSQEYFGEVQRSVVISNNHLRFGQGIRCVGAKSQSITGNLIEFCFAHGIQVQSVDTTTGPTTGAAGNGVTITGNVIKNCIDRQAIDALNAGAPYISISGDAAQAGGLTVIPGEVDSASGDIEALYQYFENNNNAVNTTPIPHNYNIVVSNNICVRDIAAQTNISDLGYGSFYVRGGPVDPAIALTDMDHAGVRVSDGVVRNALISNNIFMGIDDALFISADGLIHGIFAGNYIYDMFSNGITVDGANTNEQHLTIRGNVFDIDPLHIHSNRAANGTWTANGSPAMLLAQNSSGFIVEGNRIRNCCRISDINATAGSPAVDYKRNLLECEPVAYGFSTSNKGIGNVPRSGDRFIYRIMDSDPASANYGTVSNVCFEESNAMPATGTYVGGHFIRNNTPTIDGNNMIVLGWVRLTIGTGHVSGTDWGICHVSHATPAT